AAWALAARAQQPALPVIGVLSPASPAAAVRNIAALRQGLRELGYVDGRNIAIEYRFAEGVTERLDKLAAELGALKPALIVVGSTLGIVAAHAVTTTVPLLTVGLSGDDPGRRGLARSFARPGGNLAGFLLSADAGLVGKRLSLLRGAVPRISRLGVIANPDSPSDAAELTVLPAIAAQLSLHYRVFEVRTPEQLDAAFAAMAQDSFHALYVSWTPVLNTHRARVIALAGQARLPAVYGFREFVRAGGPMFYGPAVPRLYRRASSSRDQ